MKKYGIMGLALLSLSGCGEDKPTFSLLPENDIFYQNSSTLSNKVDILFMVDNSGSMSEEQANLATNFNSFISGFVSQGYDFHIAVAATDAWRAPFTGNQNYARFKDGLTTHTGIFVIDQNTLNPINVFNTNVRVGINGSGDERAFQSFKEALNSPLNTGFRRSDAFLAIVIVSDEDDFSHNSSTYANRDYNYPGLHTISYYTDYLDQLTQSTGALRRYSVSTIAILDQACLNANSQGIIGQRYMQLAQATDGVMGDICSTSFADSLDLISTRIAELSTQFYLSRTPRPETIQVWVNGAVVPEDANNGWTYNAAAVSIVFHGTAIPPQGAQISIDFDPLTSM